MQQGNFVHQRAGWAVAMPLVMDTVTWQHTVVTYNAAVNADQAMLMSHLFVCLPELSALLSHAYCNRFVTGRTREMLEFDVNVLILLTVTTHLQS